MTALDFGLKLEGASDELVAAVDAAVPVLQNKLGPDLDKLEAIWAKPQPLAAHIAQSWPIVLAALPDIKSIAPTGLALVKFLRGVP